MHYVFDMAVLSEIIEYAIGKAESIRVIMMSLYVPVWYHKGFVVRLPWAFQFFAESMR